MRPDHLCPHPYTIHTYHGHGGRLFEPFSLNVGFHRSSRHPRTSIYSRSIAPEWAVGHAIHANQWLAQAYANAWRELMSRHSLSRKRASEETPQSVVPREREETGMTDGVTRGEIDAKLPTIEANIKLFGRIAPHGSIRSAAFVPPWVCGWWLSRFTEA